MPYQINKDQIGLMGFSAGSHLATITALWPNETKEEKPNFLALIYGVTDNSASNIKWIEENHRYKIKLKDDDKTLRILL